MLNNLYIISLRILGAETSANQLLCYEPTSVYIFASHTHPFARFTIYDGLLEGVFSHLRLTARFLFGRAVRWEFSERFLFLLIVD